MQACLMTTIVGADRGEMGRALHSTCFVGGMVSSTVNDQRFHLLAVRTEQLKQKYFCVNARGTPFPGLCHGWAREGN